MLIDSLRCCPKLQCLNGVKKTYWISCNVEPDIKHLSLDQRKFPSSFIVKPRDLTLLLLNFQTSLQKITIIATEPSTMPSGAAGEVGGKAVELRSYIDPTKDNSDAALHTQLWLDPAEEFLQYTHSGNPVDITFGVKELKFVTLADYCRGQHLETNHPGETQGRVDMNGNPYSQHHPSNWVDAGDEDEDDEDDLYVQTTPQFYD